jgi:hypothetical protein
MNKMLMYGSIAVFSTLGGLIPALWHAGFFSLWGIIGGLVGGIFGVWVAVKINNYVDF